MSDQFTAMDIYEKKQEAQNSFYPVIEEVSAEDRDRYEAVKAEVNRKVNLLFLYKKLYDAETELNYWRENRETCYQIMEAVERDDAKRIVDLIVSVQSKEERFVSLEQLKQFTVKLAWDRYERGGIKALKKFACMEFKYSRWIMAENIDKVMLECEAEVKELSDAVSYAETENADTNLAVRSVYMFGDCHELWSMKKRILKTDYGIEWKTPGETHPYIDFD